MEIKDKNQAKSIIMPVLADMHVIYVKLRNYHWNVKGSNFYSLHTAFEEIYEGVAKGIDEVAEHIRALDLEVEGTMAHFLEITHVKEETRLNLDAKEMVKNLVEDFTMAADYVREASEKLGELNDFSGQDLLVEELAHIEKANWMLKSWAN